MDQLYLDNIDEYVHDQDRIVTYKWLSLTLGVHVNTAKRMLYHYLEHKRKESSAPLHATYLLSGKSVDQGRACHKVSVVREEDLEDAKSKLSLVVSVHVYSVHKALLRDSGPLYSVDYDAVKSNVQDCNRYSAIRCPDAVPLSKAELQQARESRQPPPAPPPETPRSQTNGESNLGAKACPKPKGIMGIFANKPASKNQTKTRTETSIETKSEAKSGTWTETKAETKAEPREEPVAVDSPNPGPQSDPAPVLLGNQTAKKPVPSVKEETSSASEPQKQNAPTEQRPPQTKRDNPRSKSKRTESDSEEEKMEKKKRRRIKKPQSDSSDEEVIPDSPVQSKMQLCPDVVREEEEEPVGQVSPLQQENSTTTTRRRRRRVLKSKTFLDEDGCIVTEKGYVSESYSEAEEEVLQKKVAPKAAPVRPQTEEKKKRGASNANKGTKQASIMGFFHKK